MKVLITIDCYTGIWIRRINGYTRIERLSFDAFNEICDCFQVAEETLFMILTIQTRANIIKLKKGVTP